MTANSLSTVMANVEPRELSGSATAGRYGFQADVGILKLIELHQLSSDFCLVFDYFDDMAVLDNATDPKWISLYQIKSKDAGDWTIAAFCQRVSKTTPRSIMSKAYAEAEPFLQFLAESGIISNAAFKVDLAAGGSTTGAHIRIPGADMHADETAKIAATIKSEYDPNQVDGWLPKLVLIRTPLGVHHHEATTKGLLDNYFEALGISEQVSLATVYSTLHTAIAIKTGFADAGLSKADMIERKSLNKRDFDELLKRAAKRHKGFLSDWDAIASDLGSCGWRLPQIIRLKTTAISYHTQRASGHAQASRFRQLAEAWTASNATDVANCSTITGLVELMKAGIVDTCGYSKLELYGALIVEAYEAIHATS